MACPNKAHPDWIALVNEYGEGKALALWEANNERTPSLDDAQLLVQHLRQVYRAVEKFGLYQTVKNNVKGYLTRENNLATKKLVDNMNDWFQSNSSIYPTLGARIDPGNPIIQFGNRKGLTLQSDISSNGTISNVNFPISREERESYNAPAQNRLRDLFLSGKLLFVQGDGDSYRTSSPRIQSKLETGGSSEQQIEREVHNWGRFSGFFEDSTDVKDALGKTLPELFDSIKSGDRVSSFLGGAFIMSRLLQSSDNFSGRVFTSLQKDKLVSPEGIRIEYSPSDKHFMWADGKGIYLNVAQLQKKASSYNNVEDFIKGMELILTEEVIHATVFAHTTERELLQVYSELTEEERQALPKTYTLQSDDPLEFTHEYLRTLLQEELFGTSSARELKKGTIKSILLKALDYLIKVFRDDPSRTSTAIINRLKEYTGYGESTKQYQLSSESQSADEQLNQILKDYAEKELGGKVNMTDQIVVDGKVISANAVTDVVKRAIDLANGKVKIDTLPEEVAHIYVHWLPKNSLLLRDMLTDIRLRPIYDQVMEEYKDNKHYQHPDGTVDEHKIALEAIGKQIAGTIVGQYTDKKSKNLLQRLIDWITGIFKGKTLDSYEQIAQNILNKDISKLQDLTTKTLKNELQSIVNQAISGEQQEGSIQAAIQYIRGSKKASAGSSEIGSVSQRLWGQIQGTGLQYKGFKLTNEDKLGGGSEHLTYRDPNDKSKVVKIRYSLDPSQLEDYLKGLLIYNYFFPNTPYRLLGFDRVTPEQDAGMHKGEVAAVVEQRYVEVEGAEEYDYNIIEKILNAYGFEEVEQYKFENKEVGITIEDLMPRNVPFDNGIPLFIDPILSISDDILYPTETIEGGNLMFQLSKDQEELVKHYNKVATPVQKLVMADLYTGPHTRMTLDEATHTYTDADGKVYTSVTTAIGGTWTEEQQKEFEQNTKWGTQIDGLLQDVILGNEPRETPDLPDAVRMKAFGILNRIVGELTADGSILLPQAIMADPVSGIAGSIDILVVHPDGSQDIIDMKASWSSVEDSAYRNKLYERGAGAKITQALTKEGQHNIQVQCYSKLAWLNGYQNAQTFTRHLYLNVSKGVVRDVEDEGLYKHLPSSYRDIVDTIIPTIYQGKDKLEEWNNEHGTGNPTHTNAFRESAEDIPAITPAAKVTDILTAVTSYQKAIEATRNLVGFRPRQQTLEKVVDLVATIDHEIEQANIAAIKKGLNPTKTEDLAKISYHKVYTAFIQYSNEELAKILQYLGNEKHWNSEEYIRVVRLAQDYVGTFKGVMGTEKFATPEQKRMLYDLQTNLQATLDGIAEAFRRSVDNGVIKLSTNPDVLDAISKDITATSTYLRDISNSGNPILENIDKLVKIKMEEVRENTDTLKDKVRDAANKLVKAAGKKSADIYDVFFQKDKNGKRTGRMISKIGDMYWQMRNKVENPLYNDDGSYKEYIKDATTPEALQYNKDLYYLKNARREFVQAEKVGTRKVGNTREVYSEDGDYHKLTDAFKADREKWMKQDKYGTWKPIKDSKEFKVWQGTHYDYVQYQFMNRDKKGNPTGIVEDKWGYFPKEQYTEVRDTAADGTNLVDGQYAKLFAPGPKTPLQQAQAEFYDAYRNILLSQIEKLPPSAMEWFNKGFIPTLRSNWMQMLANKDASVYDIVSAEMRDFFSTTSYTNQNAVTASGTRSQSLPIMYMGKLQDQERLNRLQKQVGEYAAKRGSIPVQVWQKEYKRLKDLLKHEQSRVTAAELNPDLAEGLMAFVGMAENFHIMSGIEDQVQAVKQVLSEMEFDQKGKKVAGKDSNAYRRFSEWMEMAFYYDNNHNKDVSEIVGKRLKNLTSIMSIPFKVFGGINNALIASINNNLDAYGNDFYDLRAITRMSGVFISDALPGLVSTWSDHKLARKDQYKEKKNGSKYEALAHKFNMVEHYQEGQGKVDILARTGGYFMQESGEWMVQTKVGNAILDSIQMGETVDGKLTGKTLSVYDAHEYDPNTGHTKLKEGYVYLNKDGTIAADQKQEQRLIHNRIRETNKRIHGNYRPIDKVWIEKYWLGQLAMQFHKWVVPYFSARFREGKWDDNLGGGMYVEGRWRSAWALIKMIKDTRSAVDGWANLTQHQKNNVKKDLADLAYLSTMIALGFIVKGIANGIPDDDPYLKRFANYIQYEVAGLHSRAFQEVAIGVPVIGAIESYQLIKNPFAVSNTLKNFADVIQQGVQYPFIDDDSRYYQKGPHKGQLKIWKETKDLIPIWNNINQFDMLDNKSTFYIP